MIRIAITSTFYPAVGGMETIALLLAKGFAARGHEVTVITRVPGDAGEDATFPFRVVRRPGAARLLREVARQDVVLQMGIMLRSAWAAAATLTPVVISHQTWLERNYGRLPAHEWLKRRFSGFCSNVVASRALLTEPAGPAEVVPNCYDDRVFTISNRGPRTRDLAFVGRLVRDKGVDLLLQALGQLRATNLTPSLTIVGDGPERTALEQQAAELGLQAQVSFTGSQPPGAVAALLNNHRILVVPSRWAEPFGIVALEGLACGCSVIASDGGGLPEAVGPVGRLFAGNNPESLRDALRRGLSEGPDGQIPDEARARHLERFKPDEMVDRYLEILLARVAHRDRQPQPERSEAVDRLAKVPPTP